MRHSAEESPELGQGKIRAGWSVLLRAHGLQPVEPLEFEINLETAGEEYRLTIEVAERPVAPILRVAVPLYAMRGQGIHARLEMPPGQAEGDQPGAWIVVFASRELPVDAELAGRFHGDPDGTLSDVRTALDDLVRRELRPIADTFAGVIALSLIGSRPAPWCESSAYWVDESNYRSGSSTGAVEWLSSSSLGREQLLTLARTASAAICAAQRTRTVLALCSRWLLVSHGLPHASNERFVTAFQCIEALCSLVSNSPTAGDSAGFAALEACIARGRPEETEPARVFLNAMRERLAKPSLRTCFARLAAQYGGERAQEHERRFRAVGGARNDLLHARVAEVPGIRDGVDVHEAAYELATFYLAAVIDDTLKRKPPQVVWTRGLDEADEVATTG